AARRRSRNPRTLVSSASRFLRTGARAPGRDPRQRRRACRTADRLARTLTDSTSMRYLVLTDIHAILEALDTCLADARRRRFDKTVILGDLVGYGADPNAVIERIQELAPVAIVRG